MKIITRAVLDWDGNVLEEESYDYEGPIARCKSSGSAPQPTDPYEQAAAQYGLATGTADYNAALNRTGVSNPLGNSSWTVTGYSGAPNSSTTTPASSGGTAADPIYGTAGGRGAGSLPYTGDGAYSLPSTLGSGAPLYSQSTSLQPWANSLLSSPIDSGAMPGVGEGINTSQIPGLGYSVNTSQIPGMPGGPSLQQNVNSAEQATYGQEMQLLAPQEQQQSEQTQAQLEAEGAMPGSAAYGYGENMLNLSQGEENTNAANQAVTTGMGELPMFYGLGTTSLTNEENLGSNELQNQLSLGSTELQNQESLRNAPISEFEALQGNTGGQVSAATPDISGAFNSQEQAALAAYNANVASNNATTSAAGGLASSALLAYAADLF